MGINKIYIIGVFFIFFSCTSKSVYENCDTLYWDDFSCVKNIKGEVIEFLDPVMSPSYLLVVDSFLILKNEKSEKILSKYNLNTKEKINEGLSIGNGPDEFLYMKQILLVDTLIWLSDMQKASVSSYNVNHFLDSMPSHVLKHVLFPDHFSNIVVLPNGNFLLTVMNSMHKRLSFYNTDGDFMETKGDYPSFGEELTEFEKIEGFSCGSVLSPFSDSFFLFYKQSDLIELYDLEGNLKKRLQGPDFFFPAVKQIERSDMIRVGSIIGSSRDAYFSPFVANDKVYVLYSGAYFDPRNPQYLKDKLFVFDNEGNPLWIYSLDKPILNFTIDSRNNKLYGISDVPEFHIIEYDLMD